jgi:hypothetical protein
MMRYDRDWNDRVRTEEVETVPRGKPLRDVLLLIAAAVAAAYGLSRFSAHYAVSDEVAQLVLPSAE